ncbi:MAG TPA: OB-fold nucleic acid binding domain-containing protein, partial [Stellaceae bacterium]|nr:OB-fold nucleic acid binding domain-containing protein [Stellaceae bacterium]
DLARRAGLQGRALENLARADAFRSIGLDRRNALWAVKGLGETVLPLFAGEPAPLGPEALGVEPIVTLPTMPLGRHVVEDYATVGLTLRRHPVAFLRSALDRQSCVPAGRLPDIRDGKPVAVAGLVLIRQRPGTAKGTIFMTLEDETGVVNVIVWPAVFERYRRIVMTARLVGVRGVAQKQEPPRGMEDADPKSLGLVLHVVAHRITDLSAHLARLDTELYPSSGTHLAMPHGLGDEIKQFGLDPPELHVKSRDFH